MNSETGKLHTDTAPRIYNSDGDNVPIHPLIDKALET